MSTTKWHILPIGSSELKDSMSEVAIDSDVVSELIEEYLRGVVIERLDMFNVNERIAQSLDRKIEIAVKGVTARLETEMARVATEAMRMRVKEKVAAMKLEITVKIGDEQ